jgi:RNA polymerase sigma-70 factor (ECF subfamily)
MIFRRCLKLLGSAEDALDAMQDVFVSLLRARHSLRGQYPSSLLYTIATNTCLNRLRWRKRHPQAPQDAGELSLLSTDQGYDQVEARLITEAILQTESESTRTICFMYHGDGMTLREIGNAVGMTAAGVQKRLKAFARRARILYEGGNDHV